MNAEASAIIPSHPEARTHLLPPPVVVPSRYVLLSLAAVVTGYTIKAMQRKIERGDWVEGKVWRHAPDGRIVIDLVGYQKWVEKHDRRPHRVCASAN